MHRRRSFRLAAAIFALLLVPSSVGAATGRLTPAAPGADNAASTAAAAALFGLNGGKLKPDKTGTRGSVDAGVVASKGPTKRAHATLPKLGRAPSAGAPYVTGPLVYSGPAPTEATTNADPASALPGFDGLNRTSGPSTNGEPPDPWVAVGPDHIVQAVNLQLRMTDRSGDGAIDVPLADFFGLPDLTFNSDPHVIYDSLHGRWLVTEVSFDCQAGGGSTFGTGYLDFAVSQTNDPTGLWDSFFLFWNDLLPDYPAPGTSSDKIGFAFNFFNMSGPGVDPDDCLDSASFDAAHFDVMDWTDLLNGGTLGVLGDDIPGGFTPRFALQTPATSSRLHMVVEGGDFGVNYISLTGNAAGATPTLNYERVADLTAANIVAPFATPPSPNQPGPDVVTTAIDSRPTDAIWQGNRLIFPSTYPCTPTGDSTPRDCVRVTELNTAGVNTTTSPTFKQDFLIAENGKDNWMGGVGLSGDGTLNVGWTRSSVTATEFPSSYSAHQKLGDALASVSSKELLAAGTGAYTGNRWGDYLGIAQDPLVPSQVYDGNQYSGGAEWKTKITPLQTPGTTYIPVTPARILDTRTATGLSGKFNANQARTWQVTGHGGVPAGAVAVTGNVTVTAQTAAGYVSVTPTATNTPPSSTLNFPVGDTRANNLTVALSATGSLSAVYKAAAGKTTELIFDVTGYFLADDTGATFTPITPVRVLDTRTSTGLAGTFATGVPRTLVITGSNGIPVTATAITGNLTVTQQSAAGYVSITKTETATPSTSTINFPVSDIRANGVYAPLDGTGALWLVYKSPVAGAHTQVILDVTGYFEPGTDGLRFVPLNPARIMDTRVSTLGSQLVGVFHAGTARLLGVDGHWGVPAGAAAVSGNLTVTAQTGAGYVAVTPAAPPPNPATSTINFPLGDTRANGLVTPLNGSGDTYLMYVSATGKTTHLILDLSGYFE
jgi:hypothetical protein